MLWIKVAFVSMALFVLTSFCKEIDHEIKEPPPARTFTRAHRKKANPKLDAEVIKSSNLINRPESLIVAGGSHSKLSDFPWMALLRYKYFAGIDAGFKCGGSIINDRYILTAAHCVFLGSRQDFELYSVRVGEWRLSTEIDCDEYIECAGPIQDIDVEEQIVHNLFSRRARVHDIALLRVSKEIYFTDYAHPIILPPHGKPEPAAGTLLDVVGWGATDNGASSDYKQSVKVPIISKAVCREKFKRRGNITQNHLCAGGKVGRDACQGDSGGPLVGKIKFRRKTIFYQEGIVSWGVGCGYANLPAVYTRVSMYITWINDHLQEF